MAVILYIEDNVHFRNYKDFPKAPILFAQEHLNTANFVIYYPKNSFLTPAFNKQLSMLNNGGLIDYWAHQIQNKDFFMKNLEEKQPSILSFSQIQGPFYLLMGCLTFSVAIFSIEILSMHVKFLKPMFEITL